MSSLPNLNEDSEFVYSLSSMLSDVPITYEDIVKDTTRDQTLCKIRELTKNGWPEKVSGTTKSLLYQTS